MKLKDLKQGMVCELRNGSAFIPNLKGHRTLSEIKELENDK